MTPQVLIPGQVHTEPTGRTPWARTPTATVPEQIGRSKNVARAGTTGPRADRLRPQLRGSLRLAEERRDRSERPALSAADSPGPRRSGSRSRNRPSGRAESRWT